MTDTYYILAIGNLALLRYTLPSKYHEPIDELQSTLIRDYYQRYGVKT